MIVTRKKSVQKFNIFSYNQGVPNTNRTVHGTLLSLPWVKRIFFVHRDHLFKETWNASELETGCAIVKRCPLKRDAIKEAEKQ